MTRFLSRIWNDPECGRFNNDTERLFAYHQATKHTYHSVRTNARDLDWRNQPDSFRSYEGVPRIDLSAEPGFPNAGTFGAMAALTAKTELLAEDSTADREKILLDRTWLSRLLWHSMAVSAWKKVPGAAARYSLRVNPSSGNLHPTETYIASRAVTGIDNGLYHYRADLHAIELRSRGDWTRHLARALGIPWASESPLIVGLTSIFWREAWKYGERAYRYCCHDLGHAMMSVLLAARALGLPGGAVAHFSDARLARAMGLTESDEAPMAFLVFPGPGNSVGSSGPSIQPVAGIPNELSSKEVRCELILGIHASTVLPDPAGPLPQGAAVDHEFAGGRASSSDPPCDAPLGVTVRARRSALDFDAHTPPMGRDELQQLLDFSTRDWRADWRGNFNGETPRAENGADLVALYLYVHRVRDCRPGVYRWDRVNRTLELLHTGDVQRVAAFLSLEQALAGNSCFTVSMIADLDEAARRFGNRGYRYVYFEAGAIGQRFYVGAEALGWNATGIGAFYDDDVHRYFGFLGEGADSVSASVREAEKAALVMLGSPASRLAVRDRDSLERAPVISESGEEHPARTEKLQEKQNDGLPRNGPRTLPRQVIYHFAVGRAVPDPRLEA
ncbi:MAG TPA: SagB/ThcOx family dehydrogenase [Candidatus Acidoferrales bacterium]|jgi:SagB-type dehydrogenase family enzyme|nr:SagB/ThcOx family dehydrogenase [Candidatus Acidoferrales bacterium]